MFNYLGVSKTFAQWQALGYDTHSIVVNPNFNNFTNFVPVSRLNYGINLGTVWQTGLSTTAAWILGNTPTTSDQNGTWQVGARVY
jgi:membrane carboxypeptidase/penicillin-binding protein